ncbi:MAG: type II/IV secretion system protein [Acidobacteria bacterium]|nr:type II/IV secretion system protein [Acidobacteriota bacterium]
MSSPTPGQGAPRKLLGERLVAAGLLTERQLELAVREQKRTGVMLGEIITQLGLVTPQMLSAVLAEQGGVRYVDLGDLDIPPAALALVPEEMARRLNVVPLSLEGDVLTLAMANIYDIEALGEVEAYTRRPVEVSGAAEEDIHVKINEAYGERKTLEELIEEAIQASLGTSRDPEAELPVVRLVDQILLKAVRDRATDLHVQPGPRTVLTRYRVDGTLHQGPSLPKAVQAAIVARFKILAEVNLAENRLPQDGKFQFTYGKRHFDVRASFLPNNHGEKVVLRFLDKTKLVMGLDQLGMPDAIYERFTKILALPHGVILVTGPTGSGKTTTLYSALNSINGSDRCIVTVEDPVEYELPLITQVQVNVKAGLTFAAGLRSILRQDPDIILIGEIRDRDTAEIAMRAAMTGHLVLSTLHTNDPVGSIPRLKDMGVSNLELAASLQGVLAQRLVRANCQACSEPYAPEPEALTLLKPEQRTGQWEKGRGCEICGQTGIRGRRPIHDLLFVSPAIRELIAKGAGLGEIEAQARAEGKTSLFEHAFNLARKGLITLEEALRVSMAEEA